jgi:hypothetical protein
MLGKYRNVVENGQANTPLLIFRKITNGWQKRFRQKLNTNNLARERKENTNEMKKKIATNKNGMDL